jgi:hypothetical protein
VFRFARPALFIGDPRRSLDDVVTVTVGVPDPAEYDKAFSVREVASGLPMPYTLSPEETAAAQAAAAAEVNAAQALRIRREPGEPVISGSEDQPCFLWRVADADPRRVWLLGYE